MFPEKVQCPWPGGGIGFRSITVPAFAVKGMARIGIKIEFVGFSQPGQLGIQGAHFIGWRVLVQLAEVTLDGAMNPRNAVRRRRTVTPGFVNAAPVKIHSGAKNRIGCGHQTRNSTAHTKTHDAQSIDVCCYTAPQKLYRGIHIVDYPSVSTTARALLMVGVNFRAIPVIEIGSYTNIARLGDSPCHLLGKLADTILILYNNDCWNCTRAFRLT